MARLFRRFVPWAQPPHAPQTTARFPREPLKREEEPAARARETRGLVMGLTMGGGGLR